MKNQIFGYLAIKANNILEKKDRLQSAVNKIEEYGTIPAIINEINKPLKQTSVGLYNVNSEKNNNNKKFSNKFLLHFNTIYVKGEKTKSSKFLLDNLKSTLNDKNDSEKDIELLNFLLQTIPGYKNFLYFNNIKEEVSKLVASHFKYKKFNKGEYIFYEGDPSDYFYCILKGKISIRSGVHHVRLKDTEKRIFQFKNLKNHSNYQKHLILKTDSKAKSINENKSQFNNLKQNVFKNEEKELIIYSDGFCFGEWGIIYNKPRSATAYALDDVDMIYIEKENFSEFFTKYLIKADQERRIFLKNNIEPFKKISKFDDIYKRIVYKIFQFDEIVFSENTPSKYFYLIYSGEFKAVKNSRHEYLSYRHFVDKKKSEKNKESEYYTNTEDKFDSSYSKHNLKRKNIFKFEIENQNNIFNLLNGNQEDTESEKNSLSNKYNDSFNQKLNMTETLITEIKRNIDNNFINKRNENNKNQFCSFNNHSQEESENVDKNQMKVLVKFEKGSFTGLENIYGIPFYRYSLRACDHYNSAFRISINDLCELRHNIKEFFLHLFLNQDEIFSNIMHQQENVKKKFGICKKNEFTYDENFNSSDTIKLKKEISSSSGKNKLDNVINYSLINNNESNFFKVKDNIEKDYKINLSNKKLKTNMKSVENSNEKKERSFRNLDRNQIILEKFKMEKKNKRFENQLMKGFYKLQLNQFKTSLFCKTLEIEKQNKNVDSIQKLSKEKNSFDYISTNTIKSVSNKYFSFNIPKNENNKNEIIKIHSISPIATGKYNDNSTFTKNFKKEKIESYFEINKSNRRIKRFDLETNFFYETIPNPRDNNESLKKKRKINFILNDEKISKSSEISNFPKQKKINKKKLHHPIFVNDIISKRAQVKVLKNIPYKSGFYDLPLVALSE